MGLKLYLPIAVAVFLAATMGADVVARTSIAGQPFDQALREHLYWAGVQSVGTLLLLAPFAAVAFVSARAEKRARRRGVALIFAAAMLALLSFYFQGYQWAQHALLEEKWTAAALSVGVLPFFRGIPVVVAVVGAGGLLAKFDPQTPGRDLNHWRCSRLGLASSGVLRWWAIGSRTAQTLRSIGSRHMEETWPSLSEHAPPS